MPTYTERHIVTLTTNGDGDATAYTPMIPHGKIITVRYVKADFADGVDFTITLEATGETVWTDTNINNSETVAPRQPTHSTAGVASLYDTISSEPVEDHIYLANDRIKCVIASGGATKTGALHFLIG